VLRRRFRGKFVAALKSAFQHRQLHFSGELALLAQPKAFASWLRPLFRKNWVIYCKPPFGGPKYVLQYLGRHTHRVADELSLKLSIPVSPRIVRKYRPKQPDGAGRRCPWLDGE
jgi:hypothetical protein